MVPEVVDAVDAVEAVVSEDVVPIEVELDVGYVGLNTVSLLAITPLRPLFSLTTIMPLMAHAQIHIPPRCLLTNESTDARSEEARSLTCEQLPVLLATNYLLIRSSLRRYSLPPVNHQTVCVLAPGLLY